MTSSNNPLNKKEIEAARNAKSYDHIVDKIFKGIEQIIPEIVNENKPIMIIIDGPAGVGKSTFSKYLYEQLQKKLESRLSVAFLEQDLFGLSRSARIELDVHPCSDAARDLELAKKADEMLENKEITVPKYNKFTGGRVKDADTRPTGQVIVYEGVSALGLFYPAMDHKDQIVFKIFVQPKNEEVLEQSRLIRDTSERNISREEFEKEWRTSQAYNWIFTYRGRENANLTVVRQNTNEDGSVPFELTQVADINFGTKKIDLGDQVEVKPELVDAWKEEREKIINSAPHTVAVFLKASLPIVERFLPGKNNAKQIMLDIIHKKQGLGSVVSLIGTMEKASKRDGGTYSRQPGLTQPQKYTKLVLNQHQKKNPYNPEPRSSFVDNETNQPSVILNMLEPSSIPNDKMYNLSNLELVLSSPDSVKQFLIDNTTSEKEIERVLTFQKQLKEFYNPSQYYKLNLQGESLAIMQPTSPYFNGQVLIADIRGNVPSFQQKKEEALSATSKSAREFNKPRRKSLSTLFPEAKTTTQPQIKTSSWEYEDAQSLLLRRRDLTLDEAKKINQSVSAEMQQVGGHISQSNASLMMGILKDLKPGDILGQNSPSAITDKFVTHIQCFNESETGILPIFNAQKNEVKNDSNVKCYELDYPATAYMFEFQKIDDNAIKKIKDIQKDFEDANALLNDSEKGELALIARKNSDGKFQIVFMLRKNLEYHKDLVKQTAEEVLLTEDNRVFKNNRPGFLELAGCFLQDNVKVYNALNDAKIDKMLTDYSASAECVKCFHHALHKKPDHQPSLETKPAPRI